MQVFKFVVRRAFSGGPYNPMQYLHTYVPTTLPTEEEIKDIINTAHESSGNIVHNLRHINPVRLSGPVPPFDGPFCMEDMLQNAYQEYFKIQDICYESQHPEEIMRRVPGITREEAEYITTLGLTPDDEVEYAWYVKNCGVDPFYPVNLTYTLRQVLTNQKGEKVEVLWPYTTWEDPASDLSYDTAIQDDPHYSIRHWEFFTGDDWYKYGNNQDLGVPDTWFEYERNMRFHLTMVEDNIDEAPVNKIPWPSVQNPNCRKELWRSQETLQKFEEMKSAEWKLP